MSDRRKPSAAARTGTDLARPWNLFRAAGLTDPTRVMRVPIFWVGGRIRLVTDQLFDGELGAFTSRIWFIEAQYHQTVQAVKDWRQTIQLPATFDPVNGPLRSLLGHLEPWAANSWKQLIVATASPWTALFSQGADIYTFEVVCRSLGCRAMRTNYDPHVIRGGRVVRYGDTALWLTDGSRDDLGPLQIVRVIQATNQDGWEWELSGEPQPFEEPSLYTRRQIRDRFDLAALNRYCAALGIERASESFYGPHATIMAADTSGWPTKPRTYSAREWLASRS